MIDTCRYCVKLGGFFFVPLIIMLFVAGCESPGAERGTAGLESSNPAARIMAIKQAVDSKDTTAISRLVDCLQNEDESVRFYAVAALRRITGTDRGYDYKDSPQLRQAAVKRWRDFLDPNGVTE